MLPAAGTLRADWLLYYLRRGAACSAPAAVAAIAQAAASLSPAAAGPFSRRVRHYPYRRYVWQFRMGMLPHVPPGSARHVYGSSAQGEQLMLLKAQALWGCGLEGSASLARLSQWLQSPAAQRGMAEQLAGAAATVRQQAPGRPHLQPHQLPPLALPDLDQAHLGAALAVLQQLDPADLQRQLELEFDHARSQWVCPPDGFHELEALTPLPR